MDKYRRSRGLWHINDQTYKLFAIMEEEIRQYFTLGPTRPQEGTKSAAVEATLRSEDIV